ncbi:hypothetical protein TGAM01_v204823 [Trichoderma gamsii]|uniref:RING-type domain-containing protein n=1 Tax=Trichoderma gamsii TaxID=398673 RepID=A0A2P4ZPW4_9HYPO|nr:hypothetical protein TGAM01_v204823 [Trichoderma gamsii]PON26347.1 hypothetical protein TGAM01_v204823 [Trichoderma gamsii]
MAVNLPAPLSSSPPSSAPSAPSAPGPAAPSPLQRRRLPPPHPWPAPSSSLQLPASSTLAFYSDIASASTSTFSPAATSATVSVSASTAPASAPLPFWPAYDNSISLPSTWNESAHALTFDRLDRFGVSTAINQAVIIAAGTPLPPLSPSLPLSPDLELPLPFAPQPRTDEAFLLQDFDIHSDIDAEFGDRLRADNLRARARALASTLATFSATSASAPAPTAQRPAAPRQRHHRAIQNQASPPALLDGFALPRTVTGASNGIFDEPEDIPNFPFPFPFADAALPPLSSSSASMPAASTARRRSRRQTITSETFDDPTSTSASTSPSIGAAHGNKRQRIVPLGADANQHIIDDDGDSLFGDSKSLPVEDYTTIDLTEATDVPEELKKPKVDNRTKLSGFQCVICMDDVTGLTLTHCGHLFCAQCLHSSLNIDSTRGKCPMCRSKIDMKPRETYTTKTKGYWPLELKLMTRSRQGKRKAQAMA